MSPVTAELLPLFLKLAGRSVLVVGGGEVAGHKIASLLDAGARVKVVAPAVNPRIEPLARDGRIAWLARPFDESDVDGTWLVFAATADTEVQRRVARACAERRAFCVAVDDPENASAYSGSVIRRAPFTIAISSGGTSPALTRLLREVLEQVLPDEQWVDHARRLRARWMADGTPMGDRFGQLVREFKIRAGP